MNINEAYEAYRSSPSEEAMEVLYPMVRERVTRVIGKYFKQEPDEDLIVSYTTDVLMRLGSFKGDAKFSTWVTKVAHNFCLDNGRIRRRNVEDNFCDLSPMFVNTLQAKGRPDFSLTLREAFEQLTEGEKTLLSGKIEGRTSLELARILRVTRHAIDLRWAKLKAKLREMLPAPIV